MRALDTARRALTVDWNNPKEVRKCLSEFENASVGYRNDVFGYEYNDVSKVEYTIVPRSRRCQRGAHAESRPG